MKKNSKDTKLSWNDYEIVDKNTGVIGTMDLAYALSDEEESFFRFYRIVYGF